MTREAYITSQIKKLDRKLFCERDGSYLIIKRKRNVPVQFDLDGYTLTYLKEKPHNILFLTHDWSMRGRPVDWGVDQIIMRLNKIDMQNRDVFRDMDENNRKHDESGRRYFKGELEAWASDSRSVFKKAFADINTSTVAKIDRRRLKDKQIKN